jgi:murein DD-endopeptidase MepM/ murein hydrolase activator NlpD
LISKRKSYHFNNHSLQFETEIVPLRMRIKKAFRCIVISGLISAAVFFAMQLAYWSPMDIVLHSKISIYKNNYLAINNQLDSLHKLLQNHFFVSDNHYRTILGLDSLPTPMRIAGIGGALPILRFDAFPYSDMINATLQKSEVLKNQLKIQEDSYNQLFKKAVLYNKESIWIPAIQPVSPSKNVSVSSNFGSRSDPFTSERRTHEGLDFVGPLNTDVFATADGIVTLADDSRTGYGKEIVLLHDFGYSTRYAHLNKILVVVGQKITRGELIGEMGNTGRSTGTHLHYEVRIYNRPVNPLYYFADDLSETDYEQITKQN